MPDTDMLLRIAVVVGLLILTIPLLIMSIMWFMMGGMMGPMGGPAFLGILPLLLALGIGYAGYKLLTLDTERDEVSTEDTGDPVERLQERYARGDLTEAEFEQQLEHHLDDGRSPESIDQAPVDTTNPADTEFER